MASKNTSGVAAMRYATAYVDTAEAQKKTDAIAQDMNDLEARIYNSADFVSFTKSPLISKGDKIKTIQVVADKAKFQDITSNFLKLLVENSRLDMISNIINAVRKDISVRRGEVVADVTSAFPLDAKQQKELQATLEKSIGKKIAINVDVDKDLIGGMIVTVGSQMFDASVKRKLERLRIKMMSSGANTNDGDNGKAANTNK